MGYLDSIDKVLTSSFADATTDEKDATKPDASKIRQIFEDEKRRAQTPSSEKEARENRPEPADLPEQEA